MWTKTRLWRFTLCILLTVGTLAYTVKGDEEIPSESQCRPYIEKALKEQHSETGSLEENESNEDVAGDETKEDTSAEVQEADGQDSNEDSPSVEVADEPYLGQESLEAGEDSKEEENEEDGDSAEAEQTDGQDTDGDSKEEPSADDDTAEQVSEEAEEESEEPKEGEEQADEPAVESEDSAETETEAETAESEDSKEDSETKADGESEEAKDDDTASEEDAEGKEAEEEVEDKSEGDSVEESIDAEEAIEVEGAAEGDDSSEAGEAADESDETAEAGDETAEASDETTEAGDETTEAGDEADEASDETAETEDSEDTEKVEESEESAEGDETAEEADTLPEADDEKDESNESEAEAEPEVEALDAESDTAPEESEEGESKEGDEKTEEEGEGTETEAELEESEESAPEEDLLLVREIPENLRSREHINQILRLNEDASEAEITVDKSADIILRDLKKHYENSIKPLESLYKYRDLSNRHFGDPEIFSKPLVLFMGPWSGGKSSILNYITGLEFTEWSLRTGAEPSPAYFNILMHGQEPQVLDGTQLAADWTFSGLQKFGQGLEERLRGLRHPSKILEKVNIVEIPGILEVRKQVSRVFPFNDACQWFIDRADIIFLVYDPSKLDVGPETEAILDQLKGRESQTRILLNKADSVKPEELMRVQSALIWNISPLMSSAQPPVMYTVSLWSMPFEPTAPARLLLAQERELFKDLRNAIDKRIENKIASARRFAVRVRNHAKMVDCYLTTYYNHKTIFGNKKVIAEAIIDNPQNYHIYEGLSTLTNISRYDLPDPETYRDFFRLNPLYEFQQLSATCTYFRGCPINRLDVCIAYDLPELVGKYKKMVETSTPQGMPKS